MCTQATRAPLFPRCVQARAPWATPPPPARRARSIAIRLRSAPVAMLPALRCAAGVGPPDPPRDGGIPPPPPPQGSLTAPVVWLPTPTARRWLRRCLMRACGANGAARPGPPLPINSAGLAARDGREPGRCRSHSLRTYRARSLCLHRPGSLPSRHLARTRTKEAVTPSPAIASVGSISVGVRAPGVRCARPGGPGGPPRRRSVAQGAQRPERSAAEWRWSERGGRAAAA